MFYGVSHAYYISSKWTVTNPIFGQWRELKITNPLLCSPNRDLRCDPCRIPSRGRSPARASSSFSRRSKASPTLPCTDLILPHLFRQGNRGSGGGFRRRIQPHELFLDQASIFRSSGQLLANITSFSQSTPFNGSKLFSSRIAFSITISRPPSGAPSAIRCLSYSARCPKPIGTF